MRERRGRYRALSVIPTPKVAGHIAATRRNKSVKKLGNFIGLCRMNLYDLRKVRRGSPRARAIVVARSRLDWCAGGCAQSEWRVVYDAARNR